VTLSVRTASPRTAAIVGIYVLFVTTPASPPKQSSAIARFSSFSCNLFVDINPWIAVEMIADFLFSRVTLSCGDSIGASATTGVSNHCISPLSTSSAPFENAAGSPAIRSNKYEESIIIFNRHVRRHCVQLQTSRDYCYGDDQPPLLRPWPLLLREALPHHLGELHVSCDEGFPLLSRQLACVRSATYDIILRRRSV